LVSVNQQSSDFRPESRGANITADYKGLSAVRKQGNG